MPLCSVLSSWGWNSPDTLPTEPHPQPHLEHLKQTVPKGHLRCYVLSESPASPATFGNSWSESISVTHPLASSTKTRLGGILDFMCDRIFVSWDSLYLKLQPTPFHYLLSYSLSSLDIGSLCHSFFVLRTNRQLLHTGGLGAS